ncbi:uncharacterized protein BCR38DRAFT_436713 [Pseudomassariella vexata]|uniref:Secreted protein n=1 Tax=Pseudomassariella vexata TaxID=1141098 RepID=A0A1Y2DVT8_9PEZI|nr:uncharacterized protein BCR38DRAFT_436713 [Pseudomassariella vexata]ORY63391.1 hypothetical protein BCR38DRAFT_436713 [Pseudomassariella vexata]
MHWLSVAFGSLLSACAFDRPRGRKTPEKKGGRVSIGDRRTSIQNLVRHDFTTFRGLAGNTTTTGHLHSLSTGLPHVHSMSMPASLKKLQVIRCPHAERADEDRVEAR